MSYKWEFCTDEENAEGYYRKLVNMSMPDEMSLEEAAEYINKLESFKFSVKNVGGAAVVQVGDMVMAVLHDGMMYEQNYLNGKFTKE